MMVQICRHDRKLRIKDPSASKDMIHHGHYRRDHFPTSGAAKAFIATLQQAQAQSGARPHPA